MNFDPTKHTAQCPKRHAYLRGFSDASCEEKMRKRPYNTDELCIAYELGYLDYFVPEPANQKPAEGE